VDAARFAGRSSRREERGGPGSCACPSQASFAGVAQGRRNDLDRRSRDEWLLRELTEASEFEANVIAADGQSRTLKHSLGHE